MIFSRGGDKILHAWKEHPRYLSCCGGTRSGKTYSILQILISICLYESKKGLPATVNSVVSETIPHLKRGAVRDFQAIMQGDQLWDDKSWNKTDMIYTFPNGSIIEFFSADSPGKVHGPARDRLFINEGQNIQWEIARQLFTRTSGRIVCDYNPTHPFWLIEEVERRENCIRVHTTYEDNNFLSAEQVAEIEANRKDTNWWRVYGEGKVGQLEGVIYDFEQIDRMPDPYGLSEAYGLDFGFTNDPTAIVHILADTGRKVIYAEEVCYKTRMLNSDIIDVLRDEVQRKEIPIYADCAEPKSIAEIGGARFNIKPCDKNAPVASDKLKFQIQFVKGWQLMVTKQSVNLIKELRNYTWDTDRNGTPLNQPIDAWNHALDAMRYAIYTHLGKRATGKYMVH